MAITFGVLLPESFALRHHGVTGAAVDLVLLERTLFDPPRAAAVRRWREQLTRSFPHAELVPYVWHLVSHAAEDGLRSQGSRDISGDERAFGLLQDTREVGQAWEATLAVVRALEASRIALRTPSGLSPGPLGRGRIEAFIAARARDTLATIWEPNGLWDPEQAVAFAAPLGAPVLWPAFAGGRPLRLDDGDGVLVARGAWLRIDGLGRRPRLSIDQLDALCDHAEAQPSSTLIFSGPRAVDNVARARDALGIT